MSLDRLKRGEEDFELLRRLSDDALRAIWDDESFPILARMDALGVLREKQDLRGKAER